MNKALASNGVVQQLEHALGTGHVPNEEKRRAAQLLSRLKSPVQVVLIGQPGTGKSRLINMLVGETVIPETSDLPPLEIVFGPKPRTVYLMADGSEQARDGLHLDQLSPTETAIVRAELPIAFLKRQSLTELTLSGSPLEQKTIVDWAMSRANIVLWCSQNFDTSEQALWSSAREALKDHSFLVLTKADQLQMKGVLTDRIARLEDVVAEEFYRMYPVATIQAISASGTDGARDEDTWTSSGGKALVDAVAQLVETGRSADADNALMFLNRYAPTLQHAQMAATEPPSHHQNVETGDEQPQNTGSNTGPNTGQTHTQTQNGTAHVFNEALEFLQSRADQMLNAVHENGPDQQTIVLDHCLETATKLSELMMEAEAGDPSLSGIQDDVMECSDLMVLFHLEKSEDAATEAVTLLLQLKKEMSVAVAT